MGKTYRKMSTEKKRKKKERKRKQFNIQQKIQKDIEDYENQKEVSELSDEILQADS